MFRRGARDIAPHRFLNGRRILAAGFGKAMMHAADRQSSSWFRGRGGRRYGIEFACIVVLKLVLLTLLWFVCIRPQPHADTSPAAVARHLAATAAKDSR
jgi:hypothetical protein